MKKNNAWNIRRLVDESFVPSTQRIILKIVGFQHALLFNFCQIRPARKKSNAPKLKGIAKSLLS